MAQSEGFYCPNGVDAIHAFLRRGIPKDDPTLAHGYAFVRNIAYNLQYLEYLNYTLSETELHVTVRTLAQKTFVITGMSVIEAILWFVLKKSGLQRTEEWEQVQELETRAFKENDAEYQLVNTLLRRLPESRDIEMPLDAMIKRVESKKLLGLNGQVYKDLNYLRKLRNRVHIHAVQHDRDTDWWSFNDRELKLMKGVLSSVLRSELFNPETEHDPLIAYLKVEETTDALADELPI